MTLAADVAALKELVAELQDRIATLEGSDDSADGDIAIAAPIGQRQEIDTSQLGKPQIVLRPAVVRVRTGSGRIVSRVVRPRS